MLYLCSHDEDPRRQQTHLSFSSSEAFFIYFFFFFCQRAPPLSVFIRESCRPWGNRWLGAHQMGNNSGDYLLYLLEVIDESLAIM